MADAKRLAVVSLPMEGIEKGDRYSILCYHTKTISLTEYV